MAPARKDQDTPHQDLEGNASSSAAGGTEADSIVEEGHHQYLSKLDDVAHSKVTTELKRHAEERDGVQAEQLLALKRIQQARQDAGKEAADLEEKARAARARERELHGKEAELEKRAEMCRENIRVMEGRLKQLEECRQTMKSRLESISQPEDKLLAQSIARIMAYSFPGKND
jgi:chromosome segregation ATPase